MRRFFLLPVLLLVFIFIHSLNARQGELIFAFRNYRRPNPQRMMLVGEIQSKTKMPEVHDTASPFVGYDTRLDQVTVKVIDRRGIKVGQKLYIIDKDPFHKNYRNGLIVGEIEVVSILNSPFYGWVLTGKGIMLRIRKGHFVARTMDTEKLERAYVLKKRGDHFAAIGDAKAALNSYNEALIADKTLPEASAALGDIYLQMAQDSGNDYPVRSLVAYRRAWNSRVNFRYNHDAYLFYKSYITTLSHYYKIKQHSSSREDATSKYLETLMEIIKEARKIKPNDDWMNLAEVQTRWYRYIANSREINSQERKIRDEDFNQMGNILKKMIESKSESALLSKLGILYYAEMLAKTPQTTQTDRQIQIQLRSVLRSLARKYNIYYQNKKRDPEIDRIILELDEHL